jgi:two-component system chemotaxis sensor kinase CheA
MENLLTNFLLETAESLIDLNTQLVRLEQEPEDKGTLGAILRHVYTIKGTCGFMGLSRLEQLAHAAENVLGQHRKGTVRVILAADRAVARCCVRPRRHTRERCWP